MIWRLLKRAPRKAAATGLAAVTLIAAPFTAHHEGLRLKAYLDPVGVPTICYGETRGVKMGDVKTKEECDALFEARLGYFAYWVDYYVQHDLSPKTHAALTSFAYNVGVGAFSKSTLLRLFNEGKFIEACNQLPRWVYAKGKKLPGLVTRREEERQLCLAGL